MNVKITKINSQLTGYSNNKLLPVNEVKKDNND